MVGTALGAVLNLGDVVPSRRYFAVSALAAAAALATLLVVPGYRTVRYREHSAAGIGTSRTVR